MRLEPWFKPVPIKITPVAPPATPPQFPVDVPRDVCVLFERLALEVWSKGYRHYSSDAILHRIRWSYHIERGQRDFKCNDHWTATLARWFLLRHPKMEGFFELRVRKTYGENITCVP